MRSIKAAFMGAAVIAGATFYAGPATASLKEVIIVQSLGVGTPPLIDLDPEERLRMAPVEPKVPPDDGAERTADLAASRPPALLPSAKDEAEADADAKTGNLEKFGLIDLVGACSLPPNSRRWGKSTKCAFSRSSF